MKKILFGIFVSASLLVSCAGKESTVNATSDATCDATCEDSCKQKEGSTANSTENVTVDADSASN